MTVTLLQATPNQLDTLFIAAKRCAFTGSDEDFSELPTKYTTEEKEAFLKRVVASGHTSILEHVQYTFSISGVSRVLTHQLVRHRHASFSQLSQRNAKHIDGLVIPPSIRDNPEALRHFNYAATMMQSTWRKLIDTCGIPPEDARFILPEATESSLVLSMNARTLYETFLPQRLCNRAQWEIRVLADEILEICWAQLPCVFLTCGPKCSMLGYCPEEHGCGLKPKKAD